MTTTFAKFANATRRNYSDLPKFDVEVLPDVRHCRYCGNVVHWEAKAGEFGMGEWVHDDPSVECSYIPSKNVGSPRSWCCYCNNDEPGTVHYRQRAWSDETECDRCGGVEGYAIGD